MKNIIDYVSEQTDTFQQREFNAVDSLVMSQLAYMKFDGVVPGTEANAEPIDILSVAETEHYEDLFDGLFHVRNSKKFFEQLVLCPRFNDIKVSYYVNLIDPEAETQFSAVTFFLPDGTAYVAYRGTDATIVGWKEDFNMTYTSPVPAQTEGVKYLEWVAGITSCPLRLGGHSKGGNVAVYSSIKCGSSIKDRILQVYSHDGPGFREDVFASGEFAVMKDKIKKTLPQSAIVGMLLQSQENYSVVKCSRFGALQHDLFTWAIDGNDFHYVQSVSKASQHMRGSLSQWNKTFGDEKRELFVTTLFDILKATEASTVFDLTDDWYKKAAMVLEALKEVDDDTRAFIKETIRDIIRMAVNSMRAP